MSHTARRDQRARLVGKVCCKPVYRVPVYVVMNDSTLCATVAERRFEVLARNAAEAANLVRDEYLARPETEIYAYGPQGGEVYRYVGWESSIAAQMMAPRGGEQLGLGV